MNEYALIPRAILSLISSSIELLLFIMDTKYLYCRTGSICKLLIFRFSGLVSFLVHFSYLVFFSFIINPIAIELFFNCWNVSISDSLVRAIISKSSA